MLNKLFSINSQKGVTMIEYALIAALVAVVAITALTTLGGNLSAIFNSIATAISGTGGTATTP